MLVNKTLVAEKRLELLHPKVLVPKTSVAPNYTTRPKASTVFQCINAKKPLSSRASGFKKVGFV